MRQDPSRCVEIRRGPLRFAEIRRDSPRFAEIRRDSLGLPENDARAMYVYVCVCACVWDGRCCPVRGASRGPKTYRRRRWSRLQVHPNSADGGWRPFAPVPLLGTF